jgi:outer membrane protein assembly factor BamD
MEEYKAAVVGFENLMKDFPSTLYREEAMFLGMKSEYLLAENSIESKKNDRYHTALNSYGEFKTAFPESKYGKEAGSIADNCKKKLEKYTASVK